MKHDLELFSGFGKGKAMAKYGSKCVVYTRVSTKEQADNNFSLPTQRKACEEYAQKAKYEVMGYFGGTYESAKTDERKEFNKMLSFIKKSKEKISWIIVYSPDRFSRSGANAIYISSQLKTVDIIITSVTQQTDATTASGTMQQNIQFIFSEYDNQLRKEKCMAGVREKILQGIWCTSPPLGYDIVWSNGKKEFRVNNTGKLLRKGFIWKAEGLSCSEVRQRLAAQGLKLRNQRISDILRNPFYCGLITHRALQGKVVEGIQEKVISKEVFLQVNGLLAENRHGYSIREENDDIPLKRFLKCDECGSYLRGYKAYKNKKYYYKCNTPGCKCNKRADVLHEVIADMLAKYTIDINDDYRQLIKAQLIAEYNNANKDKVEINDKLESMLADIDRKIERLEERFIMEEIDREMFTKYKERFVAEKQEISKNLAKSGKQVSNLEECIEKAISVSSKLATLWGSSEYGDKQALQNLVFPEGMTYNRKKDECRTPRINSIFECISVLAGVSGQEKSGHFTLSSGVSAWVARTGIEPMTFGL